MGGDRAGRLALAALLTGALVALGPAASARDDGNDGSVDSGDQDTHAVTGREVFTITDPAITESSGLALLDGLVVTTNDSGDTGRLFALDAATGELVGTTHWSDDPEDVEALAPSTDPGKVWAGDIGDNSLARKDIEVAEVPVGRGDRTVDVETYDLVYPDRPHNAETVLADPVTGRLYVVTKATLGNAEVYAAPAELDEHGDNKLEKVGAVELPVATDGDLTSDGQFLVLRNYVTASVFTFPALELLGSFDLPHQRQGESLAVQPGDESLLIGSEGVRQPLLSVDIPSPILAKMRAVATPSASATPGPGSHETPGADDESGVDTWIWLAGGAAVVAVGVLGWGAVTRRRRREEDAH